MHEDNPKVQDKVRPYACMPPSDEKGFHITVNHISTRGNLLRVLSYQFLFDLQERVRSVRVHKPALRDLQHK